VAVVLFVASVISSSSLAVAAPSSRPASGLALAGTNRQANIFKILVVLENKVDGHTLPEKAREKIFTLGDAQIRLIASLCDRIVGAGDTAGANIAFLLVTALIIFS